MISGGVANDLAWVRKQRDHEVGVDTSRVIAGVAVLQVISARSSIRSASSANNTTPACDRSPGTSVLMTETPLRVDGR